MTKNKKKTNWGEKVQKNTETQKANDSNFGYLILGKAKLIKEFPSKFIFDIMPYVVTDAKHPDRDDEMDIATPETLWYKRPFKTHRNVGADNDTVVCPTSIGKKCPICEYRAKRVKEGAEKDETDELRAKDRDLYVIVPIGMKDYEEIPHVWDYSQWLFQNLLNKELEENPKYAAFPDLEEGKTLRVRFDEEKMGKNKFYKASRIDFLKRSEIYDESILDDIPNLDKMLKILSYKELEAKFFEYEDDLSDDDDQDDDAETPRKKTAAPAKRRPAKDDDDDDQDDVADDDDDDDDEPAPRKRKPAPAQSKRRPAKDDDDDDDDDQDDDDQDDDDDEPAPVRKKKPAPAAPVKKKKPAPVDDDDDDDAPDGDDDDEPEPEPAPVRRNKPAAPAPAPAKGKKPATGKCPSGYKFGEDCEKHNACDDCSIWDACMEEKEKLS